MFLMVFLYPLNLPEGIRFIETAKEIIKIELNHKH